MSLISYLDSLVLGVVEGLTEFLPISSTGHLTVAESLLGVPVAQPTVTAYTAIIQFGATLATIIYFRSDLVRLSTVWVRGLRDKQARGLADYRFAWSVLIGSLPIIAAAFVARALITDNLRNLWVVVASLLLWSPVMVLAERRGRQKYTEADLGLREVFMIGLAQCFALAPGVSRSGATISAGLLVGATRVAATRLSFFLAIPALTGASLFELMSFDPAVIGWGQLAAGTAVSFVVGYASIAWLLKLVAKHPITVFVGYRLLAAVLLAGLLATGVVAAT